MTPISSRQISAFHSLLTKLNLKDTKPSIIRILSNGRATSTRDLFSEEIQPWIDAMNASLPKPQPETKPSQKMINKIIAMAREMGVITRHQIAVGSELKWVSDYARFNEWMNTRSVLKKPLSKYTYEEMPTLVTQYKNIYSSWLKKKS